MRNSGMFFLVGRTCLTAILNVSVEYLVTGKDSQDNEKKLGNTNRFQKYLPILIKLESIPEKSRASIIQLINDISTDCK